MLRSFLAAIRDYLVIKMTNSEVQLNGSLLLANPTLQDGVFDRAVILLADHRADHGALGIILNHPTGKDVGDFLHDEAFEPLARVAVHHGGPVATNQLTFAAFWWNPKDGLHWQLQIPREQAVARVRQPGVIVRAFVGYAGWTPGQLEQEMERQSWILAEPDGALLGKSHDEALWGDILRSLSPFHRLLADAPPHPELN